MINYTIAKSDHDGFIQLNPKAHFQNAFNGSPSLVLNSEYAFYKRNLFTTIEKGFPNAFKYVYKQFIDKNRTLVDKEIIYEDQSMGVLIIINQYWNVDEYAAGEFPEELNEEDEEDMDGSPAISIKKTDKFQAVVTMMCKDDGEGAYEKFFKKIISKEKTIKKKENELNIICHSSMDGLYLKTFRTNKAAIDVDDNYNDDFKVVSENIVKRLLKTKDKGIVLLHSEPGCGKTSYLRYLTQVLSKKRLIYLPPDMTYRLAEPDFITFLMEFPNSIIFIEDAENSLQKRDGNGNQAVSNLLNTSDGLLGDALQLQIVCTFNCRIDEIDPALMRPGRLIAEYKFEKLSIDKVHKLIEKIYGLDSEHLKDAKSMTLAEVYNLNSTKFTTKKEVQTIGFKR